MNHLVVLYDARCGLCARLREWLVTEPSYVTLELVPAQSPEVRERFGLEVREAPEELVIIDDAGGVYRGADAFLMCLWALVEWRPWALRLATPTGKPLARTLFGILSNGREGIAKLMFGMRDEWSLRMQLEQEQKRLQASGAWSECRVPTADNPER